MSHGVISLCNMSRNTDPKPVQLTTSLHKHETKCCQTSYLTIIHVVYCLCVFCVFKLTSLGIRVARQVAWTNWKFKGCFCASSLLITNAGSWPKHCINFAFFWAFFEIILLFQSIPKQNSDKYSVSTYTIFFNLKFQNVNKAYVFLTPLYVTPL